jgi:protein-tyrosine-phosphatase/DNA-binding transcriptional ArsR family regulator
VKIHQTEMLYLARVTPHRVSGSKLPPTFLTLAGHPVRWRLLNELARSDRHVSELCKLLDQPQSLVSYHLLQLRKGSLVSTRRSSADGRAAYYSVDLAHCRKLLVEVGDLLHPRLVLSPTLSVAGADDASVMPKRVLFVCRGNSARSQMAEAFLARETANAVAWSAGSHPKPLHPNAVNAMREHGIDISGGRSKHLDEFAGQQFDYVVSVCDLVREICPEFRGAQCMHWSIPDPSREAGDANESYPAYQRVASELAGRVQFLGELIDHSSVRRTSHASL